MSKPVIFTISAAWDQEASVWDRALRRHSSRRRRANARRTLAKISAMALDLLPEPRVQPARCPQTQSRSGRSTPLPFRQSPAGCALPRSAGDLKVSEPGHAG